MTNDPSRPRVVFVNRFYWPDEQATAQLLVDLAEGLAARGWPITVVTSRSPGATSDGSGHERRHGVEIVRVGGQQRLSRSLAGKAFDYAAFTVALRRGLGRELARGDWLVALTDPPSLAPLAAATARRRKARLIHLIKDIHPEVGFTMARSRWLPFLSRPWIHWRDRAWRQAEFCVTISQDMASLVAEHGVMSTRLRVIPDWAPGGETLAPVPLAQNELRHAWGVADKFVVAYSGNLGRVHALEPVLAAAALLRNERDLVFLFIGDGPRRPTLEAAARAEGLTNVRFLPPQPRSRLAESLSVGDVHLVTLLTGCERCVFPSKLYGILAVARPVVFVGSPQCELAQSVRQHGAGLVIPPDDPAALAAALRELRADAERRNAMAEAAARWAHETGGLPAALAAWTKLLEVNLAPRQ